MVGRWLEALWEQPERRARLLRYSLLISTAMLVLGFAVIIAILLL